MRFSNFVSTVMNLPANISVLICGDHGIGKSESVYQIAERLGFKHDDIIERRLSQMTEGDMIGLPSIVDGVTRFNPPDWISAACNRPCVLFLDELNRATTEVMQAAFQLCLDRKLMGWKLHSGTRVFAAVNKGGAYQVQEMDPALIDRFFVVDLQPEVEEWLQYCRENNKMPEIMCDFFAQHPKFADPCATAAGKKDTSRRSAVRLAQTATTIGLFDDPGPDKKPRFTEPMFYDLSVGFLGIDAAIALREFLVTNTRGVTLEEWLKCYDDGTKGSVRNRVKKMPPEAIADLSEKLFVHVKQNGANDDFGKSLSPYLDDLGEMGLQEQVYNTWVKLCQSVLERDDVVDCVKILQKYGIRQLVGVFGVKPGDEGIGMTPCIPSFVENNKLQRSQNG
jgi:hypothetical protein